MKRLILVVMVLLVCVVGFGFYRGWFSLSSSHAGTGSDKVNISLTVDPDKMKADTKMSNGKPIEPAAPPNVAVK